MRKLFYTFDLELVRSSTLYEEVKLRDHKRWLSKRSLKGHATKRAKRKSK